MKKIDLPIKIEKDDLISPTRPALGRFLKSILITFGTLFFSFSLFFMFSYFFIQSMDIETEKKYFGDIINSEDYDVLNLDIFNNIEIKKYFENYTIYISDEDIENAYATLGANIIITRKLLENIKSQEELLFILGHEKAHINNRDVLINLSRTYPIILTLDFMGLNYGHFLINTNKIISSYFSKKDEYQADLGGINFLNSLGMNTECATDFFKRNGNDFESYGEFISTHPDSKKRLKIIEDSSKFQDKECTELIISN